MSSEVFGWRACSSFLLFHTYEEHQRTENEDMVQRALRALEEGDPFSDTDLPVDSITQGRHARREN